MVALGLLSGLFLLIYSFLLVKWAGRGKVVREVQNQYIYCDRSGLGQNPPTNFIDVQRGKTLNIKFGEWHITIADMPVDIAFDTLRVFEGAWTKIKESLEGSNADFLKYYSLVCVTIHKLAIDHVDPKKRARFTKAINAYFRDNVAWVCDVCEQIMVFWTYIKKKIQILAAGKTLLEVVGDRSTWSSLKLDSQGRIKIEPRYGISSNSSRN